MTRYQSIMKQIARLAAEAATLSREEEYQAAVEIKLAAECASGVQRETRNPKPETHHLRD